MGNGRSKLSRQEEWTALQEMFRTAEARSKLLLEWYLEDRRRDEKKKREQEEAAADGGEEDQEEDGEDPFPSPFSEAPSEAARLLLLWSSGRRVGVAAVEKILRDFQLVPPPEAVRKGRKKDRRLSSLVSCVSALASRQCRRDSSWRLPPPVFASEVHRRQLEEIRSYCDFVREEVEWAAAEGGGGNGAAAEAKADQLAVLASKLRVRAVEVGLAFEVGPTSEAVDAASLRCWAEWALSHLLAEAAEAVAAAAAAGMPPPSPAPLAKMASRYTADFDQLLDTLKANLKSRMRLELREFSYHTFPVKGQKRWWIDVMLRVHEESNFSPPWTSREHKVSQVCLTRGFPPAPDYTAGVARHPHYLSVWDCAANDLYRCNHDFRCVKCGFVDRFVDRLFGARRRLFRWLEEEGPTGGTRRLIKGLETFEVVQTVF